ncbi:S66 peptidase family protein [Egicoccus sp. AB-alg2]|uniref:S66 family peptidase n=1 Tax=Egicoccus sp. AB-alg2 TaxID=3242693 RepID=UPI00359E61A0
MLTKPRRLRAGDRLAAVSLSWGGAGTFPHRYEAGKRQLEEAFGVEIVEMPHTLADAATLAAKPAARADDLHRAFADPDIAGVVSVIGGDDSIRLLPHLDLDLLAANPKVFLGYSDTTITQMALLRAGVVSFYGPAIMAGFAENAGLHDYLVDGIRRTLFEPTAPLQWPENRGGWTVEQRDWADPADQQQARALQPPTGWRWHGGVVHEGPSLVGCLEVLDFLRGTAWWPSLEGVVLFLETSEDQPPPERLTYLLRTLALTGELERLAGLVFGRPGGANLPVEEHGRYDDAILDVVRGEQGLHDLPVVTNVDFGHTDPIWTVPQGTRVRIDPATRAITFCETAVR